MKQFLGYIIKKAAGKGKVSPTIKSVKPTKDISGSVKRTKTDLDIKNLRKITKLKEQKEAGIKSARLAQKELRRAAETKRATKIGKSYYGRSVPPTQADLDNPTVVKTKKFKTGKELEAEKKAREKKMGGGMMGRRMGYSQGKLVGNQKKIDVAAPFGTINEKDFAKLRAKKKGAKNGKTMS